MTGNVQIAHDNGRRGVQQYKLASSERHEAKYELYLADTDDLVHMALLLPGSIPGVAVKRPQWTHVT